MPIDEELTSLSFLSSILANMEGYLLKFPLVFGLTLGGSGTLVTTTAPVLASCLELSFDLLVSFTYYFFSAGGLLLAGAIPPPPKSISSKFF